MGENVVYVNKTEVKERQSVSVSQTQCLADSWREKALDFNTR